MSTQALEPFNKLLRLFDFIVQCQWNTLGVNVGEIIELAGPEVEWLKPCMPGAQESLAQKAPRTVRHGHEHERPWHVCAPEIRN
jgi:hypothetical protein